MEVNKKWEFSSFCTAVIVDGVFCWDVNPSKEAWCRGRDDDVLGQDTGVLAGIYFLYFFNKDSSGPFREYLDSQPLVVVRRRR